MPFVSAQVDYLLYKHFRQQEGFSARSAALGGATGAMGGDPASMTVNPAGSGLNYRSQLFFTMGMDGKKHTHQLSGILKDEKYSMSRTSLYAPQLGVTFAMPRYRYNKPVEKGWASTSLSFYYSRRMSHGAGSFMEGQRQNYGLADVMAEMAKGMTGTVLNASNANVMALAYNTYLIDDSAGNGNQVALWRRYSQTPELSMFKHTFSQTYAGSSNHIGVNLALNYSHKFYIGAQWGVRLSRFDTRTLFMEKADSASFYQFGKWLQIRESASSGLFVQLGGIWQITKLFRAGLAYTPSLPENITLQSKDQVSSQFDSIIGYAAQYDFETPEYRITYVARTPAKTSLSLAWVKEKKGLLSVDVDFIQYNVMSISTDTQAFVLVNRRISEQFKNSFNYRIGGELFHKNTFYRGGFAWYGDMVKPAIKDIYGQTSFWIASLGWGIHGKKHDLDIGYSYRKSAEKPYNISEVPLWDVRQLNSMQRVHSVLVSYSLKF